MISRFLTIFLPIIGILHCPFVCMGTGMVKQQALTSSCCSCEHTTSGCGDSLPQDEGPERGGCHHECVNNALIEFGAKTLVASLEWVFLVDGGWLSEPIGQPLRSAHQSAFGRNATHPELTSGIALRVMYASLLI